MIPGLHHGETELPSFNHQAQVLCLDWSYTPGFACTYCLLLIRRAHYKSWPEWRVGKVNPSQTTWAENKWPEVPKGKAGCCLPRRRVVSWLIKTGTSTTEGNLNAGVVIYQPLHSSFSWGQGHWVSCSEWWQKVANGLSNTKWKTCARWEIKVQHCLC